MRKRSKWFKTDLGYRTTIKKLEESPICSSGFHSDANPGIYTFIMKQYRDVKFQITNKGKFAIHFPDSMSHEEPLKQVMSLLTRPDGKPATILSEIKTKNQIQRPQKKIKSVKEALKHSKRLLFKNEELMRLSESYEGEIEPDMILNALFHCNPDLTETSCLIQHLKTGYEKEVWSPFQKYRQLLEKHNFDGWNVPAPPILKGVPRGYSQDIYKTFEKLPEKEGEELEKLKTDLLTNISKIMLKAEHGSPLNGECDFCPSL